MHTNVCKGIQVGARRRGRAPADAAVAGHALPLRGIGLRLSTPTCCSAPGESGKGVLVSLFRNESPGESPSQNMPNPWGAWALARKCRVTKVTCDESVL